MLKLTFFMTSFFVHSRVFALHIVAHSTLQLERCLVTFVSIVGSWFEMEISLAAKISMKLISKFGKPILKRNCICCLDCNCSTEAYSYFIRE